MSSYTQRITERLEFGPTGAISASDRSNCCQDYVKGQVTFPAQVLEAWEVVAVNLNLKKAPAVSFCDLDAPTIPASGRYVTRFPQETRLGC